MFMVTRTASAGRPSIGWGFMLALTLGLAAERVEASANLTFTLTPQAGDGRINYAGGAAPIVGEDLRVASVKGLGTPDNGDVVLPLDDGTLTFKTGNLSGTTAAGSELNFAPGGHLELEGGIPSLGIKPGTALVTGSFTKDTFMRTMGDGDLKIQGGAFFNVVNPILAAYYGLPTGGSLFLGGLGTLISAPTNSAGGFTSAGLTSGSVTTAPVPEPATLAVFTALAVGGLIYVRRRPRRAA